MNTESTNKVMFLSHPLSNETIGYGGKKAFEAIRTHSLEKCDSCNQSEWRLSNHIGTHIDVPLHFCAKGKAVDAYSAEDWIFFHPQLIEVSAAPGELIQIAKWCEMISSKTDLLLIKTGFEGCRGQEDYWAHNPGFSPELAAWIRTHRSNVRAVGFDFISITSYDHRPVGRVAHGVFLGAEGAGKPLIAIEDMHLSELLASPKRVIVAPLRVEGADGSPVTVIAEA